MGNRQVLVYLAGASREHERVKKWADAIVRAEHLAISLRWFDTAHLWTGQDHELSRRAQTNLANAEELAIRASRIFWMLWPESPSAGAFIEYGYALAHRFHVARHFDVIASGPGTTRSVFTASADFRDDADALAFDALLRMAERHMPIEARP